MKPLVKILYFHQHFSTLQGSAGTRSYEMAQALIRSGHSVTMICGSYTQGKTGLTGDFSKGRRRGVVDGIDVIEFNLSYANHMLFGRRVIVFLGFALRSIEVALREPADMLFATSTPLTAGIPGIFFRWLRGRPFVFEVRDLWPELPKAMGTITNPILLFSMSVLEWVTYRSASRLIGLSPGIVEGIEARGVERSRISMVPNGCDLKHFSKTSEAWRPHGVMEGELLAIFTGTHGPANGLNAILDAALVLKERGIRDIKIALVGEGKEKIALKNRVRDENLNNIIFVDPIPKAQLNGLMAGADLGLQVLLNVPAFYFGTSPNKFFDYIAAGLPVLNNYPGWLAGLIVDNRAGFSVPPDDPAAFAEALISASQNRQLLAEKALNAYRLAKAHFSREVLSESWVTWVTEAEIE